MRAGLLALAIAVMCCETLGLSVAAGQSASLPSSPSAYRAAVARYRVAPDDGVRRLREVGADQRERGIADALSATSDWTWDELAAAAMMHTDLAVHLLVNGQAATDDLAAAERLIVRSGARSAVSLAYARRWHTMTIGLLKRFDQRVAADALAARSRERFADAEPVRAAREAYRRGVVWELTGNHKGVFLTPAGIRDSGALVQRYFVAASSEFEAALKLDPALLDAWLHLGRMRLVEGRRREAAEALERALPSASRATSHLASLFLGVLAEQREEWESAEARYRHALSLYPHAQSATLALAQLLDRRGRNDAPQLLNRMIGHEVARIVDPWWSYFDEAQPEPGAQLSLLRAEILQ